MGIHIIEAFLLSGYVFYRTRVVVEGQDRLSLSYEIGRPRSGRRAFLAPSDEGLTGGKL